MKTLTVFTPTYNRGYILSQLYESLKRQTLKDFCWLIVDDGSTDNTRDLVKAWMKEPDLDIQYYWQQNSGKMHAHNYAVTICKTELFLCCDSDDYLTYDAVEKIVKTWRGYKGNKDIISGIVSPKAIFSHGKKINTRLPDDCSKPMTLNEFSREEGDVKETALVFSTSVIINFPFLVQEGEKFIPEGISYREIDKYYRMIVLKDEIMICEYLPDGYSSTGGIQRLLDNPKSMAIGFNSNISFLPMGRKKIAAARDYLFCSLVGGANLVSAIRNCSSPLLSVLVIPLSLIKYCNVRRKYEAK